MAILVGVLVAFLLLAGAVWALVRYAYPTFDGEVTLVVRCPPELNYCLMESEPEHTPSEAVDRRKGAIIHVGAQRSGIPDLRPGDRVVCTIRSGENDDSNGPSWNVENCRRS